MLKRFACICLVVSTMGFATGSAVAQGAKGGGKAPAESAVDIELDDPGSEPTGPVVAGQMTEEAAQAKRLFDSE